MSILLLTNRIPFPLNDGGNLAVHAVMAGFLDAKIPVSMLAMNTTRHWVDTSQLPDLYKRLQYFQSVKIDNNIKPLPALASLIRGSSYNIDRFVSKEYSDALISLLEQQTFDIVQLEGLFLVPYIATIRKFSKAKVVIRQHNIEFKIWERLAVQTKNPLKKIYLRMLCKRMKEFELRHINDYDLVLSISKEDDDYLKSLGCTKPTLLHPFGIAVEQIPFVPSTVEPISLYHIGAMDWLPNQESVQWLLEKVMPIVSQQLPDTKLYLAGRNMPDYYYQQTWQNVEVLGEVPDALVFERDKSILLVPLLSGGGVRIKIFQGMAMGKGIVTTSIGVEGIEAIANQHVLIADNPQDFAQSIINLVQDPKQILELGTAARTLIETKYNRKRLIGDLLARYEQLLHVD